MTIIASTVPHRETAGCRYQGGTMHCYVHMVDEVEAGSYRTCGECFHVYRTADDLLVANARVLGEMALASRQPGWVGGPINLPVPTLDPEKIWSCPLCTHDF